MTSAPKHWQCWIGILKSPDFVKATSILDVAFFCGAEQLSDGFLW